MSVINNNKNKKRNKANKGKRSFAKRSKSIENTSFYIVRAWDISVKNTSHMSIRKTGIALWRGSSFSLRTLKREITCFVPGSYVKYEILAFFS